FEITSSMYHTSLGHDVYGMIFMRNTRNIHIINNKLTNSGHNAILALLDNESNIISGNYFDNIGMGAVYLSGVREVRNTTTTGPVKSRDHQVTNNYIQNVGQTHMRAAI